MYIDPFWAGVLATIFAEAVAFIMVGLISSTKKKHGGN